MTTTDTPATITLDLAQGFGSWKPGACGYVTLTPIVDPTHGMTVYLVTPDAEACRVFGATARAGQVIGGMIRNDRRRGWDAIGYTDRDRALACAEPVYDLPTAKSRTSAARALLRWWNGIDCGKLAADSQPWQLNAANQRYLLR